MIDSLPDSRYFTPSANLTIRSQMNNLDQIQAELAFSALREKYVPAYQQLAEEADREMLRALRIYEDEHDQEAHFNDLFGMRERARWAASCGGDEEWMAEQRMEAMMLGEWDFNSGTPNW